MDFRTQSASLDTLAGITADALVLLLAGDTLPAGLDAAVAAAIKDAIKLGDFELKSGKTLVLQRATGVKAPRLVLAAVGKPTLKAARAAALAALTLVKGRNAAHAALAFAGFDDLGDSLIEQAVLAATEAVYLYRHTKPSAAAPSKLAKLTLLVG